jgi:hypothetical protein
VGAAEQPERKLTRAELNELEGFLSSDDVAGFRAALVRLRADPFARVGKHGASFSHFAAQESAVGCLTLLLSECGASPNQGTASEGECPLHWVTFGCGARCVETAELLLARGAHVDHRSGSSGETPLFNAARRGHLAMVQRLIACGADPAARSLEGRVPADVAPRGPGWEALCSPAADSAPPPPPQRCVAQRLFADYCWAVAVGKREARISRQKSSRGGGRDGGGNWGTNRDNVRRAATRKWVTLPASQRAPFEEKEAQLAAAAETRQRREVVEAVVAAAAGGAVVTVGSGAQAKEGTERVGEGGDGEENAVDHNNAWEKEAAGIINNNDRTRTGTTATTRDSVGAGHAPLDLIKETPPSVIPEMFMGLPIAGAFKAGGSRLRATANALALGGGVGSEAGTSGRCAVDKQSGGKQACDHDAGVSDGRLGGQHDSRHHEVGTVRLGKQTEKPGYAGPGSSAAPGLVDKGFRWVRWRDLQRHEGIEYTPTRVASTPAARRVVEELAARWCHEHAAVGAGGGGGGGDELRSHLRSIEPPGSVLKGALQLHYGDQAAEFAAKLSRMQVLEAVVDGIVCNVRVGEITDPNHHVKRFSGGGGEDSGGGGSGGGGSDSEGSSDEEEDERLMVIGGGGVGGGACGNVAEGDESVLDGAGKVRCYGLFALEKIRRWDVIGAYSGEVKTADEFDREAEEDEDKETRHTIQLPRAEPRLRKGCDDDREREWDDSDDEDDGGEREWDDPSCEDLTVDAGRRRNEIAFINAPANVIVSCAVEDDRAALCRRQRGDRPSGSSSSGDGSGRGGGGGSGSDESDEAAAVAGLWQLATAGATASNGAPTVCIEQLQPPPVPPATEALSPPLPLQDATRANASFVGVWHRGSPHILVVAIADIPRHGEVLCEYGEEYWMDLLRAERGNKALERAKLRAWLAGWERWWLWNRADADDTEEEAAWAALGSGGGGRGAKGSDPAGRGKKGGRGGGRGRGGGSRKKPRL